MLFVMIAENLIVLDTFSTSLPQQQTNCSKKIERRRTKLGQGNVFSGVWDSVNGGGMSAPRVVSARGGVCSGGGGCLVKGGICSRWGVSAPGWGGGGGVSTAASGTHPTGMHSC